MSEVWQVLIIPLGAIGLWLLYYVGQGFIQGFRLGGAPVQKYTYTAEKEPKTTADQETQGLIYEDAVSALVSLGYKRSNAKATVSIVSKELDNPTTQDIIKAALGKISGG